MGGAVKVPFPLIMPELGGVTIGGAPLGTVPLGAFGLAAPAGC